MSSGKVLSDPEKSPGRHGLKAWARYGFALAACAGAIALEVFLDRVLGESPHPFVMSFAAILASYLWAGVAPVLMATMLLVIWSALYLLHDGVSAAGTIVRCTVFLAEGLLLSIGSSRIWRNMQDATGGESWHRQLVDSAAEGIWVNDDQGVITYANAQIAEMLGVPQGKLAGRKTEEFFMPEDLAVERVRAANLSSGHHLQFDRRLRRADGAEIWVLACCSRIPSATPANRKPETLALMTDITERKRAEFALRRSEERFRSLFEGIPVGVYQTTPEGRVLWANPALVEMLGFANEEQLKGADIARDLYADPAVGERLRHQLERDGSCRNARCEMRRRDGKIIAVTDIAHVVRDSDGAIVHYEGVIAGIAADGSEGSGQSAGQGMDGETILLVESEPLIRELSRDMLERQGYRVMLAANADEAERMAGSAASFDLLITAARLPDIAGAELASRLRRVNPKLRVLFAGGAGEDCIERPFSAEALGRKIRQVLGQDSARLT